MEGDTVLTRLQETPPGDSRRKAAAITVASVSVLAIVALGVVFITGVVRLGSPGVSKLTMAGRVDAETGRPADPRKRFGDNDDRVYACLRVRAYEDTMLEVRWYRGSGRVKTYRREFGGITGRSSGRFLAVGANIAFYLDRPKDGWVPGDYSVVVRMDGRKAAEAGFRVSGGRESEGETRTSLHRDPSGRFSVRYPDGWYAADPATLGGALTGFIEPGPGSFPPRFVVLMTDFDSVSLDYLNGILQGAGAPPADMFSSYSLGEKRGARRTYSWDYRTGDSSLRLRSIQVVVQGKELVYGLDCHCLESDFEDNLAVFNVIINSLRVYD